MKIEDMPVLILAGGKGTRLQEVVSDRPKPMADINGEPFMNILLNKYKNHNIYISVGYKKEYIMDYYKDEYKYIVEDSPLGTGGAIKKAFKEIDSDYLIVINGDTFCDVEIPYSYNGKILLFSVFQKDCSRYGKVKTEGDKVIFTEKEDEDEGYINSGVYIISKDLFYEDEEKFSFEEKLKKTSCIDVIESNEYFIDIGVPEDYARANKYLQHLQH